MKLDLILRIGTKLLLPFILLFALYVQFHGDFGPGGGFQAGVIAAGMVILLCPHLRREGRQAHRAAGAGRAHGAAGRADLCRHRRRRAAGSGSNYPRLLRASPAIRRTATSSASSWSRLGVLITVAGTMTAIFYAFVERGR